MAVGYRYSKQAAPLLAPRCPLPCCRSQTPSIQQDEAPHQHARRASCGLLHMAPGVVYFTCITSAANDAIKKTERQLTSELEAANKKTAQSDADPCRQEWDDRFEEFGASPHK